METWPSYLLYSCRNVGSKRSLIQSPRKFPDMTTRAITTPGKNEVHHSPRVRARMTRFVKNGKLAVVFALQLPQRRIEAVPHPVT